VLVPRAQHTVAAVAVARVHRERPPVDVPQDHAAAGPQHTAHLGQRPLDLRHVLQDLHRDDRVERAVVERQRRRIRLLQVGVPPARATLPRDREHRRAWVDPGDVSTVADLLGQLVDVVARAAADIEDPLARPGGHGLAHQRATPHDIALSVRLIELLRKSFVEPQLRHGHPRRQ
jgi:hypothetical protein